jgi:hypothetical protein
VAFVPLTCRSQCRFPSRPGVVSANFIEQGIPLCRFQPTVSRRTGIVGVQGANQLGGFLHDESQNEVGGRRHAALLPGHKPGRYRWRIGTHLIGGDRLDGPLTGRSYTASFNSLAARKAIFLLALISMASPVPGFLPMRAGRF